MNAIFITLSILMLIVCIAMVGVILMQSKNVSGLTGSLSGMGGSQTYWDKNKGRSIEGQLAKYTKIAAVIYFILALVLCFMK